MYKEILKACGVFVVTFIVLSLSSWICGMFIDLIMYQKVKVLGTYMAMLPLLSLYSTVTLIPQMLFDFNISNILKSFFSLGFNIFLIFLSYWIFKRRSQKMYKIVTALLFILYLGFSYLFGQAAMNF